MPSPLSCTAQGECPGSGASQQTRDKSTNRLSIWPVSSELSNDSMVLSYTHVPNVISNLIKQAVYSTHLFFQLLNFGFGVLRRYRLVVWRVNEDLVHKYLRQLAQKLKPVTISSASCRDTSEGASKARDKFSSNKPKSPLICWQAYLYNAIETAWVMPKSEDISNPKSQWVLHLGIFSFYFGTCIEHLETPAVRCLGVRVILQQQ